MPQVSEISWLSSFTTFLILFLLMSIFTHYLSFWSNFTSSLYSSFNFNLML